MRDKVVPLFPSGSSALGITRSTTEIAQSDGRLIDHNARRNSRFRTSSNAEALLAAQQEGRLATLAWCRSFPTARRRRSWPRTALWCAGAVSRSGPFKTKFDDAGEERYIEAVRKSAAD